MHLELFLAFVLATTILMLIPGPNVALIVANSVAYGQRYGMLTVAGTRSAMVIQLALTALGLGELLGSLGYWFAWLRWLGVIYLVYLGLKQWLARIGKQEWRLLADKDVPCQRKANSLREGAVGFFRFPIGKY